MGSISDPEEIDDVISKKGNRLSEIDDDDSELFDDFEVGPETALIW